MSEIKVGDVVQVHSYLGMVVEVGVIPDDHPLAFERDQPGARVRWFALEEHRGPSRWPPFSGILEESSTWLTVQRIKPAPFDYVRFFPAGWLPPAPKDIVACP